MAAAKCYYSSLDTRARTRSAQCAATCATPSRISVVASGALRIQSRRANTAPLLFTETGLTRRPTAQGRAYKGQGMCFAHALNVEASEWLSLTERAVRARLPDVEISRPEAHMLTFALGTRGVVLQAQGDAVIVAPSFAVGGTIGSRLRDRVQHLDMMSYGVTAANVERAADAVAGHLRTG
jgi:hypothetical protein